MYSFQELLKKIREESELTQAEFARILGVSTVLISMMETGQKEVSKGFILKLADKLGVHPATILPFAIDGEIPLRNLSGPERALIEVGENLQSYLIKTKSKRLQRYV